MKYVPKIFFFFCQIFKGMYEQLNLPIENVFEDV